MTYKTQEELKALWKKKQSVRIKCAQCGLSIMISEHSKHLDICEKAHWNQDHKEEDILGPEW